MPVASLLPIESDCLGACLYEVVIFGMSIPEFIDISSDEETEVIDVKDVKPILLSSTAQEKTGHGTANGQPKLSDSFTRNELVENGTRRLTNADGFHHESGELGYSMPLCRRFWKSGDYEVGQANGLPGQTGKNRLRIHPKFLHSNATSHKWAFGAIAELLDNAVDEVQNGATFVIVDKFVNLRNKDPALLIQDDGGGMDPESLRRCMSFGFSDKQSDSSIGQYGNGFKTSTMRLGADVIVFSRCINKSGITQSVGLLSYTFLRQTSCGDIVVPVVDYEFDPHTAAFVRLILHNENQFTSNLLTLLKWSPFSTETELLKQFDDIKHHGTKIIVFNLWLTDDGDMEIDFESEPKDIMTNEPLKKIPRKSVDCDQTQKNVAHRLNFSLRAYSSVLYLHMPDNFKLILRGEVVEPHHIVKDLIYPECIKYRPAGNAEAEILTTIGYLEGAPHVNIHGFNIYHRNRLILPFWRVANNSYGKGRGVVGVLEANFIKPTHNKQDFEKSILFQKLETRLKEMTYEYWDFHCHLVGYTKSKHPSALVPAAAPSNQRAPSGASNGYFSVSEAAQVSGGTPNFSSSSQGKPHSSQKGLPQKRKFPFHSPVGESLENQNVALGNTESGTNHITLVEHDVQQRRRKEVAAMMQENVKLQEQCLEYEESEKKLLVQEETLRRELLEAQQVYKNLLAELSSINEVKVEKLNV